VGEGGVKGAIGGSGDVEEVRKRMGGMWGGVDGWRRSCGGG